MATNGTTATTQAQTKHPLTDWSGDTIVEAFIARLFPESTMKAQNGALEALKAGDHDLCKIYASVYLEDSYIKAVGYLSSVPKVTAAKLPTLATLLSEAGRAIADAWLENSLTVDPDSKEAAELKSAKLQAAGELNRKIFNKKLGAI